MTEYGLMGVDWEERIDFSRLRRERLEKAKRTLGESDVDVLFVFRLEDIRYITGLRTHMGPTAYLGLAATVLTEDGFILYTLDGEHCQARMPWLAEESLVKRRPNLRERAGVEKWAEDVKKTIGSPKKIGVDIWTTEMETGLKEAFPNTEFVNGYTVLCNAKIIKTRDEIECLKAAAIITEAGFEAALNLLRPGVRECEVLAETWKTMTALGSEWTQCANIVASGPYTAPYRRFTSDRIIREGDLVIIDIGGCFNGYWGDFTRTYVCGNMEPTREQKALHQEAYDCLFNACAAAKPGNTTYDVYKEMAKGEHSWGLSSGHGSGTAPWEPPYFGADTKDSPVILRPGMQFCLEPYAGIPGIGGIRVENNLIVTEKGPEIYSTLPFCPSLVEEVHELDKSTGRIKK